MIDNFTVDFAAILTRANEINEQTNRAPLTHIIITYEPARLIGRYAVAFSNGRYTFHGSGNTPQEAIDAVHKEIEIPF